MSIKHAMRGLALTALLTAGTSSLWAAQHAPDEEPIITFHTTLYDQAQEANAFTLCLGATEPTYFDIDCGFGAVESEVGVAYFDQETGALRGTYITCTVSSAGDVRIYGDPTKIDYIDFDGCYITEMSFPKVTNVEILSLNHNLFTGLDLSHLTKLQALYISDNPFDKTGFIVGKNHPDLTIADMSIINNLDPSFNLSDYPEMRSFQGWDNPSLTSIDPSGCPNLLQLSIDNTNVSSVDLSNNPNLLILNVANTRVTELDLSPVTGLTELYISHSADMNNEYKFSSIDVSMLPSLQRLSCSSNNLTTLDVSNNPLLLSLNCSWNQLTSIDLSNNQQLVSLDVAYNHFDFATLPSPREMWSEYWYTQLPMEVDRSYKVGSTIDLASRVLRPGTATQTFLFAYDENNPQEPVMLDNTAFSYKDGVVTLNKVYTDSLYLTFINSELQDYPLSTSKFMVKSAEDFGKPSAAMSMTFFPTLTEVSFGVGVQGATAEAPKTFYVDFGDGELKEFTASSHLRPATPNVTGARKGRVTIYMPEGADISAFSLDGQRLMSISLDQAHTLAELSLTDCQLPTIDLSWNRCLTYLDLSGNNLTALNLGETPNGYGKTVLHTIKAARNRLVTVTIDERHAIKYIDFSDNNLSEGFSFLQLLNVSTLNVANNEFTEVDLRDLEACVDLNLSGNYLTTVAMPDYLPLESFDISNNSFSLTTLPLPGNIANYVYAPQKNVPLPVKAPTVNLSANYLDVDGQTTSYVWRKADGTVVPTDEITGTEGRFRFINTELGFVYCEMSHPLFPDFAGENILKTTQVETAGMPTHVFATFTTAEEGEALLSLAAEAENTGIYIDWAGNDDLEQYTLTTTYRAFTAKTYPGVTVKCYSYDENDGMTVFSIGNVKLNDMDASAMKKVYCFSSYDTGLDLDKIKLPANKAILEELNLEGNNISSIDLSGYDALRMLDLASNKFTTFDSSNLPALELISLAYNGLTSVKLNNPILWQAALVANELTELDLSGVPAMEQLYLSNNKLSELDITKTPNLKSLTIDRNNFTFATLPDFFDGIYYLYSNQAMLEVTPVDGIVDLSAQASCNGVATTFQWFIDSPYFDDNYELVGEELIEGTEYRLDKGVTTFLKPFEHIMCVMTNPIAPDLYLLTDFIDVKASSTGLEEIIAGSDNLDARWYDLNGRLVAETKGGEVPALAPGVYVRQTSEGATKVLVK
ncbi:MAG: hypothetical protein K2G35_02065 [Duncaniella sp.]|nr:hypothetical protein [Duncaniella sp.]